MARFADLSGRPLIREFSIIANFKKVNIFCEQSNVYSKLLIFIY